jgi:hypothetical protein
MPADVAPSGLGAASSFEDWEKDASGHLKVWPLLAFSTALFGREAGGLRLEIGREPPKPGEQVPALQLVLDSAQLRGLGEALIEAADALDNPHRGHTHG